MYCDENLSFSRVKDIFKQMSFVYKFLEDEEKERVLEITSNRKRSNGGIFAKSNLVCIFICTLCF